MYSLSNPSGVGGDATAVERWSREKSVDGDVPLEEAARLVRLRSSFFAERRQQRGGGGGGEVERLADTAVVEKGLPFYGAAATRYTGPTR